MEIKRLVVKSLKRVPAENHFKSIGPLIDLGNFYRHSGFTSIDLISILMIIPSLMSVRLQG